MDVLKMLNPLYHLWCLMKVRQMEKTEEAMRRECEKRKVHPITYGGFKMQITPAESRILPDKVSCENELKRLGLMEGDPRPTPSINEAYTNPEKYEIPTQYTDRGRTYLRWLKRFRLVDR